MGSRRLFEWVDENPHVLFYPSDYVNDPEVIARNAKMVAVNSALAVDLTGQVCADRIGCRFYSGIGGQVEFIRGASHAAGGRAIIALPSTAKGGKVSRITATLEEGAGVVTSRGDVQYVVTEFGIAYLHGKSIRERALALIDIAHPDFRDELLEQARCRFHCGIEMHHGSHLALYPAEYEQTKAFYNGSGEINLTFRAIRPSDERRLQDFFYSHSDETIHLRYGMMLRALPHQKAMELVQLDYQKQLAIIGLAGEAENEKIVAIGRYFLDEQTRLAEVAFVVHEDYRRLGIASHLLSCLKEIAQKKGFRGITAQELAENGPMLDVFKEVMGPPSTAQSRDGETELTYLFPEQNDSKPGTMMPSKKETA